MRITLIYDLVHPWTVGGAERRLHEIGRRLARRHEVHWVGLKHWDGPATRVSEDGITLHGVPLPRGLYAADTGRHLLEPAWFGAALARFPGAFRADIVDCSSFPYFSLLSAQALSSLGGATLIGTWLEHWGDYWQVYAPGVAPIGRAIEGLATRAAEHLVCISDHTRRQLAEAGVPADRLSVIPCGVEVSAHARATPPARPVDVVFVGRLIEEKGAHLLLRALADPHLAAFSASAVIVGQGPEEQRLHALAATLGLGSRVRFERWLPEAELNGLMAAAACLALPSRREGFGLVVVEAMACGTPVVVAGSPQSAAAELVRDGETGYVVAPEPAALARGIGALLEAPERRARMGAAARAQAQAYDWDVLTDRLEALYLRLRARRGARVEAPRPS